MRWDFTANHICYIDCSEAFYNNNTYNWTTFWPFKTFAITLTYYYSNAITHLNVLLLRSIVRTRHYKFIFLSLPIILTHRVVLLYIIQHRQGNISECMTWFWWASDKNREEVSIKSVFYCRFNLSYVANSLHLYRHFWNIGNFLYI